MRGKSDLLREAGHGCRPSPWVFWPTCGPAWREQDVAQAVEAGLRRAGFDGPAFDTIVASGPRAALPHGRASERLIGRGRARRAGLWRYLRRILRRFDANCRAAATPDRTPRAWHGRRARGAIGRHRGGGAGSDAARQSIGRRGKCWTRHGLAIASRMARVTAWGSKCTRRRGWGLRRTDAAGVPMTGTASTARPSACRAWCSRSNRGPTCLAGEASASRMTCSSRRPASKC